VAIISASAAMIGNENAAVNMEHMKAKWLDMLTIRENASDAVMPAPTKPAVVGSPKSGGLTRQSTPVATNAMHR